MAEEIKKLSRSEREALIKDKAGLVIVVMALFLAVTTYFANSFSGAVLKNMLKATDTYAFYQSKSIKKLMRLVLCSFDQRQRKILLNGLKVKLVHTTHMITG